MNYSWNSSTITVTITIEGLQGSQGVHGFQGVQGVQGKDGSFGGNSFDFTFDISTTSSDPGTGTIRLNNTDQNTSTIIYIDETKWLKK